MKAKTGHDVLFEPPEGSFFCPGSEVERAAQAHALEMFPAESVGQVVDGVYHPLDNITPANPEESFHAEFSSDAEAIIHSHTRKRSVAPSSDDMESQQATAVPWGILHCDGNHYTPITWFGDQVPFVAPYLGRQFLSGVRDCWCLIRDAYRREQSVILSNLPRDDDWHERTGDEFDLLGIHAIREAGFHEIEPRQLKPGDVLLARVGSHKVNHCGLYLGNNMALHHMGTRTDLARGIALSAREPVNRWERFIRHYLRHESMMTDDAEWNLTL